MTADVSAILSKLMEFRSAFRGQHPQDWSA